MRTHVNHPYLKLVKLLAACLAAVSLGTGQTKTPTIDQSLEVRSVALPQISPDGRRVIYEESRTNWETDAFETDLWIADVTTGERHLLTATVKSISDAAWSPDGRWIAFLSDRPGHMAGSPADKKQVYLMPSTAEKGSS